jgi:hypothetical protein
MFERRINDVAWCNIYKYLRELPKIHVIVLLKNNQTLLG